MGARRAVGGALAGTKGGSMPLGYRAPDRRHEGPGGLTESATRAGTVLWARPQPLALPGPCPGSGIGRGSEVGGAAGRNHQQRGAAASVGGASVLGSASGTTLQAQHGRKGGGGGGPMALLHLRWRCCSCGHCGSKPACSPLGCQSTPFTQVRQDARAFACCLPARPPAHH